MRKMTLTEMQSTELGILKFLKGICEEHNLRYYLAYGTLIGAIRHNGFIPWDDDIDLFMPREDYKKLIGIMEGLKDSPYKLISIETNPEFTAPLPKIIDTRTVLTQDYGFIEKVELGVYIDILILDGLGSEYEQAVEHYKKGEKLVNAWCKADSVMFPTGRNPIKSLIRWVLNLPYKFRGYHYYIHELNRWGEKFDYDKSRYVTKMNLTTVLTYDRNIWLWEDFGAGKMVQFEDEEFMVPANYDKLLRLAFGDYMQLPPEEQRVTHHNTEVYVKE